MRTVWIRAAMVALLSVDAEPSAPYNPIAPNAPAQLVLRATHSSLVYPSSASTTRIAPTTKLAIASTECVDQCAMKTRVQIPQLV